MATRADLREIGIPVGDILRIEHVRNEMEGISALKPKPASAVTEREKPLAGEDCLSILKELFDHGSDSKDQNADLGPNAEMPKDPSGSKLYIIPEYVDSLVKDDEEEQLFSSSAGSKIVLKKDKKPKLESVSVGQWFTGATNILRILVIKGEIDDDGVKRHLEYLAKIGKFIEKFDFEGVKNYDNDYRKLQFEKNLQWNSEEGCSFLAALHLRPKASAKAEKGTEGAEKKPPRFRPTGTADKKGVCYKFNSKVGCDQENCRYPHICSVAGCSEAHSAEDHSKN